MRTGALSSVITALEVITTLSDFTPPDCKSIPISEPVSVGISSS